MVYVITVAIILTILITGYFYIVFMRLKKYETYLLEKKQSLTKNIDNHQLLMKNFDDVYKNRLFQISLGFIQLKLYQTELSEVLDVELDLNMIKHLQASISSIDNFLKEISFLGKMNTRVTNQKESIIEKVYFEDNNFSKN